MHIFRENQLERHKLPPTRSALRQKVLRARYQAMVWYDTVDVPENLSHEPFGWLLDKIRLCSSFNKFASSPWSHQGIRQVSMSQIEMLLEVLMKAITRELHRALSLRSWWGILHEPSKSERWHSKLIKQWRHVKYISEWLSSVFLFSA